MADNYLPGAVLVYTEMALIGYDIPDIAQCMEAMNWERGELVAELTKVGGQPNEWPDYCKHVLEAYDSLQEGEDE